VIQIFIATVSIIHFFILLHLFQLFCFDSIKSSPNTHKPEPTVYLCFASVVAKRCDFFLLQKEKVKKEKECYSFN
jgi:hypothetical protein